MEEPGTLLHFVDGQLSQVDGHLSQVEDLFDDHDFVAELPPRDQTSEGGLGDAVLARSLSSSSIASDRMVSVSLEVSAPDISQFQLCGHLTDFTSTLQPVVSSTLKQSSLFDLTNSTALDTNGTASWSSEEIGAVLIISLMVPFILVSNIIVIVCVIRYRRLHTPTNYFITSLAAVDIFVALATPFVVVVEVFRFREVAAAGDVMLCLLPNRILMMGCGVSVLTLAAIAYDRQTALVSPLRYVNIMTARRVSGLLLLSWLYSVVIVWLPLMAGWYHVPSNISPCSADLINGKAPLLFLGAIFVPSCVAIMICYFRILMVARQHVKAIAAFEFAVHRRVRVKCVMRETKCLKTLALIVGVFLVLWLPYLILIFLKTVSSLRVDVWLQTYLVLLAVLNSGVNPWLYAFMNSELRAAFRRLLRDMCGDRLCASSDRRSSVISAISSTPRLSLIDSRAVSIIPDASFDLSTDQFQKRLELCVEHQALPDLHGRQFTEIDVQSLFSDWNHPGKQEATYPRQAATYPRQEATYPSQDTADGTRTHDQSSSTGSICFSLDATEDLLHLDVLDKRAVKAPGFYHQIDVHLPLGLQTWGGLNSALCRGSEATLSLRPSLASTWSKLRSTPLLPQEAVHLVRSTPLLPQEAVHLAPLLSPSCHSGCIQTQQNTSWSPTHVSSPSAAAQINDPMSPSPTHLCHTDITDSNQSASSSAGLSARPQTQHPSPTTKSHPPCTSLSQSRHPCTSLSQSRHPCTSLAQSHPPCICYHKHEPSAVSAQTPVQCRMGSFQRPSPPQTPVEARYCPAPDFSSPQTLSQCTNCPAPDFSSPQTLSQCTNCPAPDFSSPQTLSQCTNCPVPDFSSPQTPVEARHCPAPDLSSPQTSGEIRNCPAPDFSSPQTSAECMSCSPPDFSSPQTPVEARYCPAPDFSSPQTLFQCTNCPVPDFSSPQTLFQCTNCPPPDFSSPQTSAECMSCSPPDFSSPQTPVEARHCPARDPCPPLTSASRQLCGMFSHVSAYNFLLPLCETLALDVISTAARLETCIDLARLAAGEHTMMIH